MTIYFHDPAKKDTFTSRLKRTRQHFTPPGEMLISYQELILHMLDVEATQATEAVPTTTMNRNSGKFT